MDYTIKLDKQESTFRLLDGTGTQEGEMVYVMQDYLMVIVHTFVDPSLRGHGLARKLVYAGVDYCRQHHLKIGATCPYAHPILAADESVADIYVEVE